MTAYKLLCDEKENESAIPVYIQLALGALGNILAVIILFGPTRAPVAVFLHLFHWTCAHRFGSQRCVLSLSSTKIHFRLHVVLFRKIVQFSLFYGNFFTFGIWDDYWGHDLRQVSLPQSNTQADPRIRRSKKTLSCFTFCYNSFSKHTFKFPSPWLRKQSALLSRILVFS